jgi:hypothetical protein
MRTSKPHPDFFFLTLYRPSSLLMGTDHVRQISGGTSGAIVSGGLAKNQMSTDSNTSSTGYRK